MRSRRSPSTCSPFIARACTLLLLVASGTASAQGASAPAAAKGDSGRAVERCESAVAETLRQLRGRQAQEVQFAAGQRATAAEEGRIAVKGGGRYEGERGPARAFSFSCTFDTESGQTSGVVLREAAAPAARVEPAWEPDLTRLSPEACESAVARRLKERHPRVSNIALETETRRLEPGADEQRTRLLGQGGLKRAPGMNAEPFSYRCEFDRRSGRLLDVQTSV